MKTLRSQIDDSVNFIVPCADGGYFESRYVRRTPEKLAVYLSSQSGCNRGCRFCHLTATGQTTFTHATTNDYVEQAGKVISHYLEDIWNLASPLAKYVHFNFMARGEPLCNPNLLANGNEILLSIYGPHFLPASTLPKWNISTIMPLGFDKDLGQVFKFIHPTIYYSLYSLRKDFREKWLPTAMPPEKAIIKLKDYQNFTKKQVVVHGTFIENENDNLNDIAEMFDLIDDYKLNVDFNLVRYNPYSEIYGQESPNLVEIANYIKTRVTNYKEISRVGFDVKASCGMFVE